MTKKSHTQWLVAIFVIAAIFCLIPSAMAAKAAVLSIAASPAVVTTGDQVTLQGNLTDASTGEPVSLQRITLQISSDAVSWKDTGSAITRTGSYKFSRAMRDTGTYYFRAFSSGNRFYSSATSPPVLVTVNSPAGPKATTLTIRALPNTVRQGETVTVSGTLSAVQGGKGIPAQMITLSSSTDGTTFTPFAFVATAQNGTYSLTTLMNTPGRFSFKAAYEGNSTYLGSASYVVAVDVTVPQQKATTLSIKAAPTSLSLGQTLNVTGTLKETAGGKSIPDVLIAIQYSRDGGAWTQLGHKITNNTGTYSIGHTPSVAGTYTYKALYSGNATYGPSESPSVSATVSAVAPVPATALSIQATPASPKRDEKYTVSGNLTDPSTAKGVTGKLIRVDRSGDGTTWSKIGLVFTKTGGNYSVSQVQSVGGTFFYRATFNGDRFYKGSTSPVLQVIVKKAAQIDMTASPVVIAAGGTVTCSGSLTDEESGAGIAGQTVKVMSSKGNTAWTVFGTTTTGADGSWQYAGTIASAGSYYIAAKFEGSPAYDEDWSNSIGIKVN